MTPKKNSQSQAQKAASQSKQKNSGVKKTSSQKNSKAKSDLQSENVFRLPNRIVAAIISLCLFVLFLVIFLKPDGALLKLIYAFITGLFGQVGFYVAIPALLYLFVIQVFSGKRPVIMRSICLIVFTLLCGCISHLILNPHNLPEGIAVIGALYKGGADGTTGGLVCGSVAMLFRLLLGSVIPYIIFTVAAVILLLASFQITIPSIIRAIKNRPRADWEDDEKEEDVPEPAAVVVNHITNKRLEHLERRRAQAAEHKNIDIPVDDFKPESAPLTPKANDFMKQIDAAVEAPVAAAACDRPVVSDNQENPVVKLRSIEKAAAPIQELEDVPMHMPALKTENNNHDSLPFDDEISENTEESAENIASVSENIPEPEGTPHKKVSAADAAASAAEVAQEIAQAEAAEKPAYCFPPVELLNLPKNGGSDGTSEMKENSRRLNETLESFKIEAHIINVTRGPSVTRYEVELDKGVRLSKLTTCADDIALSLGASGVRIAAVPGKISVVGIEVPNRSVTTVSLREVIDSHEFTSAKSKSAFCVGKDIGGSCIVGNIAKLPHMLIAGTTGSGKSVCMNSIIISLLYKASPDDVKLIMVDPKMVELGIYNGIPHLLIPVVTDPKKAAGSLQWAVTEMMRRYRSMSDAGVRDLDSYNSMVECQEIDGSKLPQVVVIIDELADLMLVAAKEVEESICRIAQMGRAAGIHLLIATQRPSADVITGLMKANIPSRIAFAVASAMESRIILDTQGAEKLVGKGDMLYAPIGCGKPKRVQGCFVSDSEVEMVANYVKNHYNVDYDQEVMDEIERKAAQTGTKQPAQSVEANADELSGDEMLPAAVDVILETSQASVSMLQRRLKLGYARAARIVDEMEERGIVGPFKGSKPREILITKEQWHAMQNGQEEQMEMDAFNAETEELDEQKLE